MHHVGYKILLIEFKESENDQEWRASLSKEDTQVDKAKMERKHLRTEGQYFYLAQTDKSTYCTFDSRKWTVLEKSKVNEIMMW